MRVWQFPTVPVQAQLFHVPGAVREGGFTTGGVRMYSPEPGGRSVLELHLALQVKEWNYPIVSWLSSKGNGEVFRIRLAPTPQILGSSYETGDGTPWAPNTLWAGDVPWQRDITASYATAALEGANIVSVNMTGYGDIARPGHVIGDGATTYIIDEVSFDSLTSVATLTVKPPLRRDISSGNPAYFRPYFTGTMANISEWRQMYEAVNVGHIQPGRIIFAEAVL